MIAEHTKLAILALIHIDDGATDAERERVRLALTAARPNGRTIRIKDAAEILDLHPNTVKKWIASGRLVGVKGRGNRMIGVTEASLATA